MQKQKRLASPTIVERNVHFREPIGLHTMSAK